MIQEILKKESLTEQDIVILLQNQHLISESDLIRLGFKAGVIEQSVEVQQPEESVEKPKATRKKKADL